MRSKTAQDVMHVAPLSIASNALAADAAGMMEHHRIHFLLVVNSEGGLCGALNTHDLMRAKVI